MCTVVLSQIPTTHEMQLERKVRIILELFLGKQFASRKCRFHRMRFVILEFVSGFFFFFFWGCSFLTEDRNLQQWGFFLRWLVLWKCMIIGLYSRSQVVDCLDILSFLFQKDGKVWWGWEGRILASLLFVSFPSCQVDQGVVQSVDQIDSKVIPLH